MNDRADRVGALARHPVQLRSASNNHPAALVVDDALPGGVQAEVRMDVIRAGRSLRMGNVRVRLVRKLAERIDGVDLSRRSVGQVIRLLPIKLGC